MQTLNKCTKPPQHKQGSVRMSHIRRTVYSSAFADIFLDNLLIYQHILKSSYLDGGVLKHREPLPDVCKHNISKKKQEKTPKAS